jgi:hypothetical protein
MAGYDTANFIYNVYQSADSRYGTPNFWVRYFSPSPNAPFSQNPVSESRAAWDSGGPHIGAVSSPVPSRLNGSDAEGFADGQTMGASLQSATDSVSQLRLPTNGQLYCWLDEEPGVTLSSAYYGGWSRSIDGWNWKRNGTFPLFPCLYVRPCDGFNGCLAAASFAFAAWSQQPQVCGHSVSNPPSWQAQTCTSCAAGPPTRLWQFTIQGDCGNTLDVDMDVGSPGFNYANNCFFLTSRP